MSTPQNTSLKTSTVSQLEAVKTKIEANKVDIVVSFAVGIFFAVNSLFMFIYLIYRFFWHSLSVTAVCLFLLIGFITGGVALFHFNEKKKGQRAIQDNRHVLKALLEHEDTVGGLSLSSKQGALTNNLFKQTNEPLEHE